MAQAVKREKLVRSAAELFHKRGIHNTSLADIAVHAGVPLGNVYYYFKTKDDLAIAAAGQKMQELRSVFDEITAKHTAPLKRLLAALDHFNATRNDWVRYGCPIARICHSLDPACDVVAKQYAKVFEGMVQWSAANFEAMGHKKQARAYAIHYLSCLEGAGLVARLMGSPETMTAEIKQVAKWVESLSPTRH